MAKPRSMLAHTLNAVKGWPAPNAIDFRAKLDPTVAFTLYAGRACHLSPSGTLLTGCHATSGMTLFYFPNSDDPDVENDGGDPATDPDAWVGVTSQGYAACLPAKGPYELETTEYATDTYAPNDALSSTNDDANVAVGGVLRKATALYGEHVCGVVSRGLVDGGYGKRGGNLGKVLAFWPVWLPPTP